MSGEYPRVANRFATIQAVVLRTRQLRGGAPPLVPVEFGESIVTTALRELDGGKIAVRPKTT